MSENKELVYKFFYAFSCFEFALKTTSFLKNENTANPDWDSFATLVDSNNKLAEIESADFKKGVKYFFDNPPKKQVVTNGVLDWEEYEKPKDFFNFKELLMLVRRVRNNLFHGGKFSSGLEQGSERNRDLISYGLIILNKCVDLNEDIKLKFNEQLAR